ncbi:MAG TPA: Hsp70 family protein, partial [Planctomycetia bacterium]|nr:Hsp70 family protein [Planctomycetia bacterium]
MSTEPSRYIVGIDLGTTNCALAYIDTKELPKKKSEAAKIETFAIPQLTNAGEVTDESLLPSFLYLPGQGEIAPDQLKLPWPSDKTYAVGKFAREHGGKTPTRLVASAKSWLCHPGIDRKGAILPIAAEPDFPKISPVQAEVRFLTHLRDAWNSRIAGKDAASKLENQDIVLTVPASFDAVARELTVEAAHAAGLTRVTLFEEPQAAFYSWIHHIGEAWRKSVKPGDAVLVVDVGGGTTDLTLVGVSDEGGDLTLTRIAVGDHLLLGGDNMDLALAHTAAAQLKDKLPKPDTAQMLGLWQACRAVKETLLKDANAKPQPVTVLGRGTKLIGGTFKTELKRADIDRVLVDGFFPNAPLEAEPHRQSAAGLQELGLPYASDPAITKHLASFLRRHSDQIKEVRGAKPGTLPTAVL